MNQLLELHFYVVSLDVIADEDFIVETIDYVLFEVFLQRALSAGYERQLFYYIDEFTNWVFAYFAQSIAIHLYELCLPQLLFDLVDVYALCGVVRACTKYAGVSACEIVVCVYLFVHCHNLITQKRFFLFELIHKYG